MKEIGLSLVCCAVLCSWAGNKARNITGSNGYPQVCGMVRICVLAFWVCSLGGGVFGKMFGDG